MEEDRVSTDDLTSFHTTFSKQDLVELKEPFIVFQITKNGNIVWNDIRKYDLQWLERTKEQMEYTDIKYPEKGFKRVDVWNDLQKKYKNVIPDVEGDCWFYIKL